jgi:hypothetical protein
VRILGLFCNRRVKLAMAACRAGSGFTNGGYRKNGRHKTIETSVSFRLLSKFTHNLQMY